MGMFEVFAMYSNSVRSFSTLRVKYFVCYNTFSRACVERKSKRSSLASTFYKISVSFKFCKLSNGDKLELRTFTSSAFRVTRYPIF